MLNWIKFTGLFVVLLELPNFAHCDGSQLQGHRIYRIQVPKGYFESIVQILRKGETEDQFEILHISRKLNDFVDVMVNLSSLKDFKKLIQEHNIHTKIIDCNIERSIRRFTAKNKYAAERKRFKRSANMLITHDFYMQFHEMEAVLKTADLLYGYASLEEIGRTAENRSLWLLKISQDPTLPIIWIDAGIHAREWISSATAFYLIDKLLSKDGNHLLKKYQFYIAPNVNPDGYVYSYTRDRLWRKNRSRNDQEKCPGTDLNRNFPYKWGLQGAEDDECTGSYRGKSAADQLETQSLVKKLTSISNQTKLFLTFHAYGQMILMPYGYKIGVRPTNFKELRYIGPYT
ncbi:hypothetical protein ACTXT7_006622 [Hymenolepis weldensis]